MGFKLPTDLIIIIIVHIQSLIATKFKYENDDNYLKLIFAIESNEANLPSTADIVWNVLELKVSCKEITLVSHRGKPRPSRNFQFLEHI